MCCFPDTFKHELEEEERFGDAVQKQNTFNDPIVPNLIPAN
jgi:hypothetical protein